MMVFDSSRRVDNGWSTTRMLDDDDDWAYGSQCLTMIDGKCLLMLDDDDDGQLWFLKG